jgi:Fe2+ or Zn2+ uptake regulation protein
MKNVPPPLDAAEKQDRLEEFRRRCRETGELVTTQRRVVLQAVLDLDCHPTADQVWACPAVRRARISRATVYRTLESLVRMGVITKACHTGGVVRYDGRTAAHHHLVCLRCDAVLDISDARLSALPVPDTSAFGFEITDFRVQLRGLCRSCRRKEEGS